MPSFQPWFLCLFLLALTGCLSPKKEVAKKIPDLHSRWQANVARLSNLPERRLDWSQALALLESNNLKLRAARVDITNNQELASQVFRDLIPTVNLRSGLSRSLSSIPATTFDDVTFNVDSFFNVPGVVNFDSRLFAGRLGVLRAKTAYCLAQREQTIELYKVFLEAQENAEIGAELKSERLLADAMRKADELGGQILIKEVESRQLSLAKSHESLQTRISDLLMDQQFRWVLTTNGLPQFNYESRPLPLGDTNRVAQLQTRFVAVELVGAWAQLHGIKLQYWPELTFFVSGPSAYQRLNGVSHFASVGDITASADFFWSLDTRGYVSQQVRQTRRQQGLQLAQLEQDSRSLIERLLAAQRLSGSLREQLNQLEQLVSLLEKVPPEFELNAILQSAETNRSLHYQLFKLRHDLAELDTLFWFVDEQQWASLTP